MKLGVRQAWIGGAEKLAEAGVWSARLDARILLTHAMNLSPEDIVSASEPSDEQLHKYDGFLARRAAHEPLAYITGQKEFWSLSFAVGPGVLTPRPETELLLDEASRCFPDASSELDVLDLGTGSGCVLIAFLHNYARARGTGIDRSHAALTWARQNAERLAVTDRVSWIEGDWSARDAGYDVIFANPPYVASTELKGLPPDILKFEPVEAISAGPDGLDAYRALTPVIARGLKPLGRAFLEIGLGQRDDVAALLRAEGLEIQSVTPDLAGIPRCLTVGLASEGP